MYSNIVQQTDRQGYSASSTVLFLFLFKHFQTEIVTQSSKIVALSEANGCAGRTIPPVVGAPSPGWRTVGAPQRSLRRALREHHNAGLCNSPQFPSFPCVLLSNVPNKLFCLNPLFSKIHVQTKIQLSISSFVYLPSMQWCCIE